MKSFTFGRFFNLLFLSAFVLLLSSCADETNLSEAPQGELDVVQIMYQQMLDADSYEQRTVLAASMTDQEKIAFWNHHVDLLLERNIYNEKQLNFFKDHRAFSMKLADDIGTGRIPVPQVCQVIEGFYENISEEIFTTVDLKHMFTLQAFETQEITPPNAANERMPVNCNCRLNSHCTPVMVSCSWAIPCTRNNNCGWGFFCLCKGRCI